MLGSGKELDMVADYFDPMSQQVQKHRIHLTVVDETNTKMEYYVTPKEGDEFKSDGNRLYQKVGLISS
ncbi:MAG: hypothetical protein ACR2MX_05650 [Cyclobacteriaceae bacterium]